MAFDYEYYNDENEDPYAPDTYNFGVGKVPTQAALPPTGGGSMPLTGGIPTVPKEEPPPGGGGGGGGMGAFFNIPEDFAAAPGFEAPVFTAPTLAQAQEEPGYAFRLKSGSDALERSAAARGVLRTGGTLKDINAWGQNFASSEYGSVFDRAMKAHQSSYQGAKDSFAPRFAEWQNLVNFQRASRLAQLQARLQSQLNQQNSNNNQSPPPIGAPPQY